MPCHISIYYQLALCAYLSHSQYRRIFERVLFFLDMSSIITLYTLTPYIPVGVGGWCVPIQWLHAFFSKIRITKLPGSVVGCL